MDIKPIETVYNGYRFRSRLEARWAVFFDELGIKYEYETEGFEVNGIRYLPDFYLPEFRCLFEVKQGGVFDKGTPKEQWLASDDYKKIIAITESIKLRNDEQNFDYIVLASGSPFDCLAGSRKEDCGLLFNGIIGCIQYENDHGEKKPIIIPLTEKDGLPLWGHLPICFEQLIIPNTNECINFFGKRDYSDFEKLNHKSEVVPIGKRCASVISMMNGIVPRYRGEPLFNPTSMYLALDSQSDERSPIHSAALKARQARFEYGETPTVEKERNK